MKNVLSLFIAFIFIAPALRAQQPADCVNCPCAIPSVLGTTLTTVSTHGPCDTTRSFMIDAARYLRLYAFAGNRYEISLCGFNGNTSLYVATNSTNPAPISCDNDGCGTIDGPSTISFVPTTSTNYRLYIFSSECNSFATGTNLEVLVTCTSLITPVNDLPCNATALPLNGSACNYTSGNNQGATNTQSTITGIGPPPNCPNAGFQSADVWFSVVVPASGMIGIQTEEGTICAGAFQLYTADVCNGTFTKLTGGCITTGLTGPTSEPTTIFNATAAGVSEGSTIYIRYWERNGNEQGSFSICAFEPAFPVNDEPCSAIPLPTLSECDPLPFELGATSQSPVPVPPCATSATVNDVWFTFEMSDPIPPNFLGISVNTTSQNSLELGMAWYTLSNDPCASGGLVNIACSASGSINSSSISPALYGPGQTIYVRIWGQNQLMGSYEICSVVVQPASNDEPCGAIPLVIEYGCLMTMYSNALSSVSGTTSPGTTTGGVPLPACGLPINGDVWFKAEIPINGILQLDMLAGTMNDAALAVYRVLSGSCATNDLNLQQIAGQCVVNGSQQGTGHALMPYTSITSQPPGSLVYIRVWRQTGADGPFGICARRTDSPTGACELELSMHDTGGDGWNGSFVTICIEGDCTNHTVLATTASISFGGETGQSLTMSYTAGNGSQQQHSYILRSNGTPLYISGNSPQTGTVYDSFLDCSLPAPTGDCIGAIAICDNITYPPQHVPGNIFPELNSGNAGCMAGESSNVWMSLHFSSSTPPCSPFAFDFVQAGGGSALYDFVIWGPYPQGSNPGSICPITQLPYRCNWSSTSSPKGLAYNNSLPTTQFGGGGPMVRHMVVNPGEVYFMMVNCWAGWTPFQIVWKTPASNFQVLASDCTGGNTASPPGSIAVLGCDHHANATLYAKMILAGPFDPSTGLMKDDLRQLGLLPLVEPYSAMGYVNILTSGGETTTSSILATTGNDAIVDWVRLELRGQNYELLSVEHALLQRDGDIVSADGSQLISFDLELGYYRLVVRHRNHLGCMTSSTITLGGPPPLVDLSSFTTATYGENARKNINGAAALWPGNVNGDERVQYTGSGNDRDVILQAIGATIPTNVTQGYHGSDVNLDGFSKYAGSGNDRDVILETIGGQIPTLIKLEQLP